MSRLKASTVAAFLVTSCFVFGQDEVARVQSPDGTIEAVLVETNAGATTSYGYRVFLAKRGARWRGSTEVASLYGAVRSNEAYGVNMRWRSPTELTVEFLQARDQKLLQPDATVSGVHVRTSLVSGVSDPTAPPGGMLYNLQGRPHDRPPQ